MERDGDHIPFVSSGPYPIRGGNFVAPLIDGEPAFRRICEAIERARKTVWGTVAFVGGINLDRGSVVSPGHPPRRDAAESDPYRNVHDVYSEIRGPAATDVHHNFVQRWNEASEREAHDGSWHPDSVGDDLDFPIAASSAAGDVVIQIQRTVRRGSYRNGVATPGGDAFPIEDGDYSIVDQYLRAIAAARRTIYLEDQAIGSLEVVELLLEALDRGVEVVFLVPADANTDMIAGRKKAGNERFWNALARLGSHERFTLAGIAARVAPGRYEHVYVHAKICLIDDVWATIGSTNIANRSFYGDTEMNASVWHGPTVRALRRDLLREHLGVDTQDLDDGEAFALYREICRANLDRRGRGEPLEGMAFRLDPATYAAG